MTLPPFEYVSDRERARRVDIAAAARVIAARLGDVDEHQAVTIAGRLPPPPARRIAARPGKSWRMWRARVTPVGELRALEHDEVSSARV